MIARNILIISNRGFIGTSLYNNLKEYNVFGLNSETCDLLSLKKTKASLSNFLKQPFTIIFLSAFGRFPFDNYEVYNKNTTMILNLLESLNTKLIEQFIFFSSTCLYGRPPKSTTINEQLECMPNGYYGLSKYVSEKLIELHLSCPIANIRIPGVYGELDSNKSIINSFINKIEKNEKITIYDKGLVLRDYVYIEDVIKLVKCVINLKSSITLNLATGKSTKLINILRYIENCLSKKAKINFKNSNHNQFDMKFDISKLKNYMPGYRPISLKLGIEKNLRKKFSK